MKQLRRKELLALTVLTGAVCFYAAQILSPMFAPLPIDRQNSPGDGSDGLTVMELPSNEDLNISWTHAEKAGITFIRYQNVNGTLISDPERPMMAITTEHARPDIAGRE